MSFSDREPNRTNQPSAQNSGLWFCDFLCSGRIKPGKKQTNRVTRISKPLEHVNKSGKSELKYCTGTKRMPNKSKGVFLNSVHSVGLIEYSLFGFLFHIFQKVGGRVGFRRLRPVLIRGLGLAIR